MRSGFNSRIPLISVRFRSTTELRTRMPFPSETNSRQSGHRPRDERADRTYSMRQIHTLLRKDPALVALIDKTDHKTLAIWSRDCAARVLHYFEDKYPSDKRPRQALETLQRWIDTGEFHMSVIRGASLGSHAAARDVGEDSPARSAARAAGQAVATAHVKTHSIGGATYALQAIDRDLHDPEAVEKERAWQYNHLEELRKRQLSR